MTNKEILKNAIKKAIKNGYDWADYDAIDVIEEGFLYKKYSNDLDWIIFPIIFSHRFAKAFWGEEEMEMGYGVKYMLKVWQYHLQMMVLEKEPLKYLEKFIN